MPPKPMSWDKKCFSKDKKHERHGPLAKQKDSSFDRSFLEFKQQGSTMFQQPVGHETLDGDARHQFSKEPSHGSSDMALREDKHCPSISRPYNKTTRALRDPRHHFWENVNKASSIHSPSKRTIDDVLPPPSHHPHFVNTWEKYHSKERCDTNKQNNHERESSVGWKPLKWSYSRRFSSQGPGKDSLLDKNTNVGEVSASETEETTKKKSRLNWGDGLAKYEKMKSEGAGAKANKAGVGLVVDKIPNVTGFLDCAATDATTTTPDVVCCSYSTCVDDELRVKAAYMGNSVGNLRRSPSLGSQNHWQGFLASIDVDSLTSLGSSLVELLKSSNPISMNSNLIISTTMNDMMTLKNEILKVLEVNQTEINSLENELKSLQSESGDKLPCSEEVGSLVVCDNVKSCDEDIGGSDMVICPKPLQIAPSDEGNIEKIPLSTIDDTLYNTIMSSNKESTKRAHEVFAKLLPKECGKINNVGVNSSSFSHNDASIKEKFAEKIWFARFKEKVLTVKYEAFNHLWKKDLCLRSLRKFPPMHHKNLELGLQTISNGCQSNQSSIHCHFPFPAGNKLSLVPTSEMISYTSQLLSKSHDKVNRRILKMPALILDEKDKMNSMFMSRNGLVEDPVAVEKERAMFNPWTSEERKIFLEIFASFGKDFRKIASFLDHKTTADCVEFFYKNKKSDCFEKFKKKEDGQRGKLLSTAKTGSMTSGKKGKGKVNVDSLKILNKAPTMAHGNPGNRRTRSGRLFLWRGCDNMRVSAGDDIDSITERTNTNGLDIVAIAADVLVGSTCGSLSSKATSSFISRSVDPVEAVVHDSPSMGGQMLERSRKRGERKCTKRSGAKQKVRRQCQQPVMPRGDVNIGSNPCVVNGESKLDTDGSDKSSSVEDQRAITMSEIMEVGKDKVGNAVTELVPASEIIDQLHSHSVAEDGMVSEELPTCLNDGDGKQEDKTDKDVVVEVENQSHDSNTAANTSLPSVAISCSRLAFGAEKSKEDPLTTANAMLQNTTGAAVQQEKTVNLGDSLDHVEVTGILQCNPLKEPVLSQKMEQTEDHHKAQLPCSSDSEKTPRTVSFKLFGNTITVPLYAQEPDLTAKGNEENGTHHPK